MAVKRVVIEYEHRSYSPCPDDPLEAWLIDCLVTHADVAVPITSGRLQDVRGELEDRGFQKHGAHPLKMHGYGRYCPTWREVWVRGAV